MRRYREISAEPLDKWRRCLTNPLRKRWARSYLWRIGAERLAEIGYDLDELLAELDALPTDLRFLASDLVRMPYGWAYRNLELPLFQAKLRDRRAGKAIVAHR